MQKKQPTIKSLVEYFIALEKEQKLLELKINEVYIWQYLRFRIFMMIANGTGIYQEANTKNISFGYLLKRAPSLLFYSIFSNPLLGRYRRKFLFFTTGRKLMVDGVKTDIYTRYFIEEEGITDYEIMEELLEFKHESFILKNRKHQDFQQILSFLSTVLSRFKLSDEMNQKVEWLEKRFKNDYDLDLNLKKLFRNGYLNFKSDAWVYSKILSKRKPEKIYVICSYGYKMALIDVARKMSIETIELQHGVVTPYHIGYRYHEEARPAYFPDKFYAFGNYWKERTCIPLEKDAIHVKGYPYFNYIKKQYDQVPTKENQILIISQGSIGHHMSGLLVKALDIFSGYQLFYKLHPGEFSRWKIIYPELYAASQKYHNLTVLDNNEKNMYAFFAESKYVFGAYSTAIFEAVGFGCNVFLLNLPGIHYMEELIAAGMVHVADDFAEMLTQLQSDALPQNTACELFK